MSDGTTPVDLPEPPPFTDGFFEDAEKLVRRYPVARSALLPLLHLVQSEHGYVSDAGISFCAERLALTKAEVGAVATFYTMYKRQPVGDYLLSVCTQPTCAVAGGAKIFDRYKDALGDRLVDPDTKVMIEEAECLGICDAAPVVQVNYEMYGHRPDQPFDDAVADALLAGCRKGEPPVSPWSGEPAPTFSEFEREISGANDGFSDHLVAAARNSVEYEVKPAYKTGMTDLPVDHPGGDPAGHGGEMFAADFNGVPVADVSTPTPGSASAAPLATPATPMAEHEPYTTGRTVDGLEEKLDRSVPDAREHKVGTGPVETGGMTGSPGTSGVVDPPRDADDPDADERAELAAEEPSRATADTPRGVDDTEGDDA